MAAPEWAYMNDAKMLWRRRLWRKALEAASSTPHRASVAIMPGKNGMEIGVVRSLGVDVDRIHIIDDNPAIVATHRKDAPDLAGTYGVSVARAFERMSQQGVRLDVAHLDFCSPISREILEQVKHVAASGVIKRGGAMAVTLLRGRGKKTPGLRRRFNRAESVDEVIQRNTPDHLFDLEVGWDGGHKGYAPTLRDSYRGQCIAETLRGARPGSYDDRFFWDITRYGAYKSGIGTLTMWWGLFRLGEIGTWGADSPVQTIGWRERTWFHGAPAKATASDWRRHFSFMSSWEEIPDRAIELSGLGWRKVGHANKAIQAISWTGELDDAFEFLDLSEAERRELPGVGPKTSNHIQKILWAAKEISAEGAA